MRIALCLHISLSYGGGGEKWAWTVAKYLRVRGHDVEVYALPYTPNNRRVVDTTEVLNGIEYHESWIHEVDADVAYVFYNPLAYLFFKCRCPRIAGMHSNIYFMPRTPPITYGIVPIASRLLYKAIGVADISLYDAVHVVNRALKVRHRRAIYIPDFVDVSVYRPVSNRRDNFTVLFVGRPSWQKGWDIFLSVAKMMKSNGHNIDFLWVGGHSIQGLIEGLGYIASDHELAKIYSSSHVVLYPSRSDTFSLVIVESLACGTPVITTPIQTHRELELPLIYASTPREFYHRILELYKIWLKDPQTFNLWRKKLRESVMKYDMSFILPKIEGMLIDVSGGSRRK